MSEEEAAPASAPTCLPKEEADEAADEDLVDEQAKAREACRATRNCLKFFDQLQSCNDRVSSRKKTAETCLEEVIDYVHCVDECAAKKYFLKLK